RSRPLLIVPPRKMTHAVTTRIISGTIQVKTSRVRTWTASFIAGGPPSCSEPEAPVAKLRTEDFEEAYWLLPPRGLRTDLAPTGGAANSQGRQPLEKWPGHFRLKPRRGGSSLLRAGRQLTPRWGFA